MLVILLAVIVVGFMCHGAASVSHDMGDECEAVNIVDGLGILIIVLALFTPLALLAL